MPMKKYLFPIFLLFLAGFIPTSSAQKGATVVTNIVPNPGFERYASPPVGWSYRGAYFGQVVKYWFSATTASPDIYGPGVHVPRDWAQKGFGEAKPHTGKAMAGITLFGCTNGKPHCREFVEIQLAEPLVTGQTYSVEFWVTHLEKSLQINNIGALFSEQRIENKTDQPIVATPQMSAKDLVVAPKGKWVKVSGSFKAAQEAEYLIIGNFHDDASTLSYAYRDDCFNYAYYYVDDVVVRKSPPYLTVPVKPDDLTRQSFEPGKTIRLKNIYFEFDKDELMPRSFVELNKLLAVLRDNPQMAIEFVGHTDNYGEDGYNLDLSRRRSKSVVDFLLQNQIAASRLRYRGEGERQPVATNYTDEGRAQNRRVEFVVVKK